MYAARFDGNGKDGTLFQGFGYSNRTARGTAVGEEPQTSYAVFSGQHYNKGCWYAARESSPRALL